MGFTKGRKGNHASQIVADVPVVQIVGQHAERRVALHEYLFAAAFVDEVVDVGAPPGRVQGGVDVGQRNAQGAGLFAVDVKLILRHILEAVGTHLGQCRIIGDHAHHLVACGQ